MEDREKYEGLRTLGEREITQEVGDDPGGRRQVGETETNEGASAGNTGTGSIILGGLEAQPGVGHFPTGWNRRGGLETNRGASGSTSAGSRQQGLRSSPEVIDLTGESECIVADSVQQTEDNSRSWSRLQGLSLMPGASSDTGGWYRCQGMTSSGVADRNTTFSSRSQGLTSPQATGADAGGWSLLHGSNLTSGSNRGAGNWSQWRALQPRTGINSGVWNRRHSLDSSLSHGANTRGLQLIQGAWRHSQVMETTRGIRANVGSWTQQVGGNQQGEQSQEVMESTQSEINPGDRFDIGGSSQRDNTNPRHEDAVIRGGWSQRRSVDFEPGVWSHHSASEEPLWDRANRDVESQSGEMEAVLGSEGGGALSQMVGGSQQGKQSQGEVMESTQGEIAPGDTPNMEGWSQCGNTDPRHEDAVNRGRLSQQHRSVDSEQGAWSHDSPSEETLWERVKRDMQSQSGEMEAVPGNEGGVALTQMMGENQQGEPPQGEIAPGDTLNMEGQSRCGDTDPRHEDTVNRGGWNQQHSSADSEQGVWSHHSPSEETLWERVKRDMQSQSGEMEAVPGNEGGGALTQMMGGNQQGETHHR
ncbi:fibrinogen alpha-1 chain-like [Macrobrachium nipponense]|uniref:fibrinogen alpha-1 chain-like n=1 Tax=Macrobrachium nipponense TaxID=159736 RepID=UPI0030C7C1F4